MRRRPRTFRTVSNPHSVDERHAPQLRNELTEALPEVSVTVRERLARTAILSKREAHRYLAVAATDESIPDEAVERARTVIDKLAAA